MSLPPSLIPITARSADYLDGLSALSLRSFATTTEATQAILELIVQQLGLRTSFLTQVTTEQSSIAVIAAVNLRGGCNILPPLKLPLGSTY